MDGQQRRECFAPPSPSPVEVDDGAESSSGARGNSYGQRNIHRKEHDAENLTVPLRPVSKAPANSEHLPTHFNAGRGNHQERTPVIKNLLPSKMLQILADICPARVFDIGAKTKKPKSSSITGEPGATSTAKETEYNDSSDDERSMVVSINGEPGATSTAKETEYIDFFDSVIQVMNAVQNDSRWKDEEKVKLACERYPSAVKYVHELRRLKQLPKSYDAESILRRMDASS